jgi:hypothetical protein
MLKRIALSSGLVRSAAGTTGPVFSNASCSHLHRVGNLNFDMIAIHGRHPRPDQ